MLAIITPTIVATFGFVWWFRGIGGTASHGRNLETVGGQQVTEQFSYLRVIIND